MLDNNSRRDNDIDKILNRHYENIDMSEPYQRELLSKMLSTVNRPCKRLPAMQWLLGTVAAAVLVLIYIGTTHLITAKTNASRLLAVAEVNSLVINSSGHKLRVGDYISAGELVRTGRGGRVVLVARNGSQIYLNECSELVLDSKGNANVGKGRLYCSNRTHEIKTINTPAGSIRLLGTILDTAVINKKTTAVTVVQGKVELSNSHGKSIVSKGNRAMMIASLPPEEGLPVDVANETSWYDGQNHIVSYTGEIAYLVDRHKSIPRKLRNVLTELWVMKSDGSDKHLLTTFVEPYDAAHSGSCSQLGDWCSGGQWVMMNAPGHVNWDDPSKASVQNQIRLVNVTTGEAIYLPIPDDFTFDSVSTSPDNKQIAITGMRGCGSYINRDLTNKNKIEEGIWLYNTNSNELRPLITTNKHSYFEGQPAWSPDNRWLAISAGGKIALIDTITRKCESITEGCDPAFSPDGLKLAYCELLSSSKSERHVGSVCVIDISNRKRIMRFANAGFRYDSPTWSPDGGRIAFLTNEFNHHSYTLYIANMDGSGIQDMYEAKGSVFGKPSWEKDGKSLYIRKWGNILKVAADGSGLIADLGGNEEDSIPPDDVWDQLTRVRTVAANRNNYLGLERIIDGKLDDARSMFKNSVDNLSELPWKYPLARLSMPDIISQVDAINKLISLSDEEYFAIACRTRISVAEIDMAYICRGGKKLPMSIDALKKTGVFTEKNLTCPGKHRSKPVLYIYTPPKSGEPKIGDVIFQCPNHPKHRVVWNKASEMTRNWRPKK